MKTFSESLKNTQAMKSIYYEWRTREQWSCGQTISYSNLHGSDIAITSIFLYSIALHIYALRTQTNHYIPLFRQLVSAIWNKLNENEPRRKQVQARAGRTRYEKDRQKCVSAVFFFSFNLLSGPICANSHLRTPFRHKSWNFHIWNENTTISASSDSYLSFQLL